jgi:hypothetical protein
LQHRTLGDESREICIAKLHGIIGTPTPSRRLAAELVEASMPEIPNDPHVLEVVEARIEPSQNAKKKGRPKGSKNKPKEPTEQESTNSQSIRTLRPRI